MQKEFQKALEKIPLQYRMGPWSPFAYLFLACFFCFLLIKYPDAIQSLDSIQYQLAEIEPAAQQRLQIFRVCSFLWGVFVLVKMMIWAPGSIISFTMTTWNVLLLRMAFAATLGSKSLIARVFLFPGLSFSTITVLVWWLVLSPIISGLIEGKDKKEQFSTFNKSFLLLNIHGVNLPVAAIEFYMTSSPLVFFDLWIALAIAFLYMLFYLFILDARGIHLYIIFTPRTHYCSIIYSCILLLLYACYFGWNKVIVVDTAVSVAGAASGGFVAARLCATWAQYHKFIIGILVGLFLFLTFNDKNNNNNNSNNNNDDNNDNSNNNDKNKAAAVEPGAGDNNMKVGGKEERRKLAEVGRQNISTDSNTIYGIPDNESASSAPKKKVLANNNNNNNNNTSSRKSASPSKKRRK